VPGVAAYGSNESRPAARTAAAASVVSQPIKVVRTERGAVSYRSVGRGKPLVLIMGFGSSMEDWDPAFVDGLARTRRVVIFNNAGIGKSEAIASRLTISRMADQTAALIAALKLGKTDVLGWSMGGMIAQALVVRHQALVRRLVLSATSPGNGKGKKIPAEESAALAGASAEEFLAALFPSDQQAAVKSYGEGIARYEERSAVPGALYGLQRAAINGWVAGKEAAGKRAATVSTRILAAAGTDDRFIPVSNTRLIARLFSHTELKIYEDAGHGFLFQPDTKYVKRVITFLTKRV
jgi:pimeloyl-ACP methyl ester carboxylesterase